VRLALDRVRELLRTGALARGRPEIDDGEALLARMRAVEVAAAKQAMSAAMAGAAAKNGDGSGNGTSKSNGNGSAVAEPLAVPALRQVLAENEAAAIVAAHRKRAKNAGSPRPPDPSAPSGAIWPPVEGRMILHEAAASQMAVQVVGQGDWASEVGSGWRAYSSGDAVYRDLERGREMLIQWARLHVACTGFLSPRRCVVVADAGDGTWRLWQIVRAEPSLRDYLAGIERRDADEATARLLESASVLLDVGAKLAQTSCPLPCTLDTIGRGEHGPIYIGLMPMKPHNGDGDAPTIERDVAIEAELELIVYDALYGRRGEVLAAVDRARRRTAASRSTQLIDRLVSRISPS